MERINVLSDSERKIFQLEWTSLAISESDEKIVADYVIVNGWYGPMDANELLQMRDHVKSTQMTVPQAISLRSAYLQQKGMVSVKKKWSATNLLYYDGAEIIFVSVSTPFLPVKSHIYWFQSYSSFV